MGCRILGVLGRVKGWASAKGLHCQKPASGCVARKASGEMLRGNVVAYPPASH